MNLKDYKTIEALEDAMDKMGFDIEHDNYDQILIYTGIYSKSEKKIAKIENALGLDAKFDNDGQIMFYTELTVDKKGNLIDFDCDE